MQWAMPLLESVSCETLIMHIIHTMYPPILLSLLPRTLYSPRNSCIHCLFATVESNVIDDARIYLCHKLLLLQQFDEVIHHKFELFEGICYCSSILSSFFICSCCNLTNHNAWGILRVLQISGFLLLLMHIIISYQISPDRNYGS